MGSFNNVKYAKDDIAGGRKILGDTSVDKLLCAMKRAKEMLMISAVFCCLTNGVRPQLEGMAV